MTEFTDCLHQKGCDLELKLFYEVSRYPRFSGEEKPLVDFIIALATEANRTIWRSADILRWQTDAGKNLLVTVPATGRFATWSGRPIALQSHLDMVLAKAGAPASEDLRKHFLENPIEFETNNGWLQSRGRQTTIGADDAIGVAMQLRYLIDRQTEHPPLELVFTSAEETGLIGAMNLALPLRAAVLINLDGHKIPESAPPGDSGLMVIRGCQGSVRFSVKGTVAGKVLPAGATASIDLASAGLDLPLYQSLGKTIRATPDRVLVEDAIYPHQARTTSNLGSVAVTPHMGSTDLSVSFGVQSRSYVQQELDTKVDRIRETLSGYFPKRGTHSSASFSKDATYPSWLIPSNHWLVKLARTLPEFTSESVMPAGIEPGPIGDRYRKIGMELISLGTDLRDPHTVNERMLLSSVPKLAGALRKLLGKIPDAPEFAH